VVLRTDVSNLERSIHLSGDLDSRSIPAAPITRVPEQSQMPLQGIGVTGIIAVRQLLKRTSIPGRYCALRAVYNFHLGGFCADRPKLVRLR
jgi:hypothetical protein